MMHQPDAVGKKIEKIEKEGIRGEKVPHKQAVAAAINMVGNPKDKPEKQSATGHDDDAPQSDPCGECGGHGETIGHFGHHRVIRCRNCGHIFGKDPEKQEEGEESGESDEPTKLAREPERLTDKKMEGPLEDRPTPGTEDEEAYGECANCGSGDRSYLGHWGQHAVFKCNGCGSLASSVNDHNPVPVEQESHDKSAE